MAQTCIVNQVDGATDCSLKRRLDLFFPENDLLNFPELRRQYKLSKDGEDVKESARAYVVLQKQFNAEEQGYLKKFRARQFRPKTIREGDHFPVKSWLQGKWKPPQKKVKRSKRNKTVNVGGSDAYSDALTQYQDLLVSNDTCSDSQTVSLIRNDGQQVDLAYLDNKLILLFLVFVPTLVSYDLDSLRLLDLSSELHARGYEDFQIILVVKMRKGWEDCEEAFSQFVHAFPDNCLSVPFELSAHRESLFESVPFHFPAGILVDPANKVVQSDFCCSFYDNYGSVRYYPFSMSVIQPAYEEVLRLQEMLITGVGFAECLLPPLKLISHSPRDFDLVNSLDSRKTNKMSTLISKLEVERKHLYLYLCQSGTCLLDILSKVCKQVDDIVLVFSMSDYGLPEFRNIIRCALVENVISCWLLTYDNSVSHRLYQLCDEPIRDELICVEPSGRYVDPYAADVFLTFGVDAYPFTRRQIIIKEYERLKKVTLGSLLFSESQGNVFKTRNEQVLASQFANCDVLVYFESGSAYCGRAEGVYPKDVYEKVSTKKWYANLVTNFGALEVVFVCFNDQGCDVTVFSRGQMKWLVCPFNNGLLASMTRQVSVMGYFPEVAGCLMSFGKDGHLCSLLAHSLLASDRTDLFKDHLREDVITVLGESHEFMGRLDPGFDISC